MARNLAEAGYELVLYNRTRSKAEKLLSHDFTPGGKVEYHRKDLGIALAAGREYGAVLPVTALVDQMFGALVAKGRGGWDHSALLRIIEDLSQHEIA